MPIFAADPSNSDLPSSDWPRSDGLNSDWPNSDWPNSDWPNYGNNKGSSKFAPLAQIDGENVSDLVFAWTWATPDNTVVKSQPSLTPWSFKVTPLKVGNRLFTSTSLGFVAALDPVTGKTLWQFDTQTYADGRPTNLGFNHRGVAYWSDDGEARILMPTNNAYLWSLDAKTGKPDLSFGNGGRVDLTVGLGREIDRKLYSVISSPMVVGDIVVVGSSIMDAPKTQKMPPGHVRGFNVKTGEQVWIFNTIPQRGEFGSETWADGAWQYSGNTNVWSGISADPELGYIYFPTGTPTNDWYGGHRVGHNLFAESLVCVDAKTGKRVWHFQMIHHGLWDYDLPAAPTLIDIPTQEGVVKAVAQVSKQAFVYAFNRVTGEPLWPIEERPVPPSDIPGEVASPTQPFPTKPLPFDRQGLSDDDLIDFTPELRQEALELVAPFRRGPIYTPPSLQGTINMPGWGGGANWSGAAYDPGSGLFYVPSVTGPMVVVLKEGNPDETDFRYVRSSSVTRIRGPKGLPLTKPPYGRVTAIDMISGDHRWVVPNGDGPRQAVIDQGIPDPGPLGGRGTGPLLTETALFIAQPGQQGKSEHVLRAFDKQTGGVLGHVRLPAAPFGTPMTYMHDGKQYIVIASGMAQDTKLVALRLP
ncbi:MAG: PQQ-binding-like beta-propeller repeat protein [Pseudomonadales bacterium]|nr:PQQ-binding-like beta-propeller repeat protein [Pseudomonadales bacterium]